MAKKAETFAEWLASVPAAAPAGPEPGPDAAAEFREWAARLPAGAASVAATYAAGSAPPDPLPDLPCRYGLVEAPDGEMPSLRLFRTPEALAARVAELDGRDVAVWAFFGVPVPLTVGPARHLLLPDGRAARVPAFPGDPPAVVDSAPPGAALQEDGFLGPPDLLVGGPPGAEAPDGPFDGGPRGGGHAGGDDDAGDDWAGA